MNNRKIVEENQEFLSFQRERYDKEAGQYDKNHDETFSQLYRTEFIRNKLFNFDLSGLETLDAMSASGVETGFLLTKDAKVTGLDISPNNASLYREKWQKECYVTSIHDTGLSDESFDVIYISGGLHHIIPYLEQTIIEIHRLLKPGGYFMFVEPNKDTWLNALRMFWYKRDKRFHETEAAISYKNELKPFTDIGFKEVNYFSGGNIAYLLISQAHILKTPYWVKKSLYKILSLLEKAISTLPFSPHLYFAATWQKINKKEVG